MRRALRLGCAFAVAACLASAPLLAQQAPAPFSIRSQVLTIESDRLFPETRAGQAILAAIAEERRAFAAENQVLVTELRAEELELTERRATLSREEFAQLAEAFDQKVEAARQARDAAQRDLDARAEEQENRFLLQVQPILGGLMAEAGAVVLIEADTVLLRSDLIDITEIAITRINEATQLATDREPAGQGTAEEGAAQD